MEIKYTHIYIINDKLVVADKIEKAIALYKCKFPCRNIESLTLLNNTLRSDSYDKDFDALIEDAESKGKNEVDYEHATINQTDFAPKEEPRFKVGYWIVNKESKEVFHIEKILVNTCKIVDVEGNDYHVPHYILEEEYKLWTAKDGDVLASKSSVFIFQEEYIAEKPIAYCGILNGRFIKGENVCWTNERYYPATKEQRDALMKAMNDAGWEFDFATKELKSLREG